MKKVWKENAKMILTIVISVALASGVSYATVTMYASNTVSYDNTYSGLDSDNVQGALDRLYVSANNYVAYETRLAAVEDYKNQIYPVGSIYISVSNTNPSTLFGGTWAAFGTGRTLVGINTSDTAFNTVEKTGGAKQHQHIYGFQKVDYWSADIFPGSNSGALQNGNGSATGWSSAGASYGANVNGGFAGSNAYFSSLTAFKTTANTSNSSSLQPYITVYMWKRTA